MYIHESIRDLRIVSCSIKKYFNFNSITNFVKKNADIFDCVSYWNIIIIRFYKNIEIHRTQKIYNLLL